MSAYVVIKTLFDTYKCHDFRLKNSRVYFNGRAVNLGNVVSITAKDGSVAYKNSELTVVKPKVKNAHHVSTLKGAVKCKATVKALKLIKGVKQSTPKKPSSLPDVIEI
jgi:hypothetical protein